jgi:hypothetical protein
MPLSNAERQRRFRRPRARREQVAGGKIDHRDAQIRELKAEIARLRSGARLCKGFAHWPTPIHHDGKGRSGRAVKGEVMTGHLPDVVNTLDMLVVDQTGRALEDPLDYVVSRDGRLRLTAPGVSPAVWGGDRDHPNRSL